MIFGRHTPGPAAPYVAADRVRVSPVVLPAGKRLAVMTAYLDGLGPANAGGVLRGVVYGVVGGVGDRLLARSAEVAIADQALGGWVVFEFPGYEGLELPAGTAYIGVHIGGVSNALRLFLDDTPNGHRSAADTYIDGTSDPLPAAGFQVGVLSCFLTVFDGWAAPTDVDEDVYARLPFELSQRVLSSTGVIASSRLQARAGFHGTTVDLEAGANAIVRSDGPLAHLVGERVKVTRRLGSADRAVYVYVHDEQEWPEEPADEDISLTRRAWLEIAPWPTEVLLVSVETMS